MTQSDFIARITEVLGERLQALRRPSENRVYLDVAAEDIVETAHLLSDELAARFQTASGLDGPQKFEILYHWAFDARGLVVTVRTCIDRDRPEIASIMTACPAAEWIEREMWELLGIIFHGHPDLRHLLLQDDWPAGRFPLRRDFQQD